MVKIDLERCDGCGDCVAECPNVFQVVGSLCRIPRVTKWYGFDRSDNGF